MTRRVRWLAPLALAAAAAAPVTAQQPTAYEQLQTFSQVVNYIFRNYPDSVEYGVLVKAAIDGVLRDLDPHSLFFSRIDWERRDSLERGELAVTGMHLEDVGGTPTVLAVYPGGPADRAGIAPGDRILAVDDTVVAGLDMEKVRLRLAGADGSKVRVRLERGPRLDPDTFTVTVKRRFLEARYVSASRMLDSVTGYVRLDEFGLKSADEVHDAVNRLKKRHARRLILDLRDNPGGLVEQAVDLVSEFVPKGTVVFSTRGRKRDADTTFVTRHDGSFRDLPLVVLVNSGSASAAEATAASLQDHDRAVIVGRRTFGKALMQTDFLLSSGEVLHMTIGHVIAPSGRVIQRRYRGLAVEQYYALAGRGGAGSDTAKIYHTDAGRPVRGGDGVEPDVVDSGVTRLPAWWVAALDSGLVAAVTDSATQTLEPTAPALARWTAARDAWAALGRALTARARARFRIPARADSAQAAAIAGDLAIRVAEERWGPDAAEGFALAHDRDVAMALRAFDRLPALLKPAAP